MSMIAGNLGILYPATLAMMGKAPPMADPNQPGLVKGSGAPPGALPPPDAGLGSGPPPGAIGAPQAGPPPGAPDNSDDPNASQGPPPGAIGDPQPGPPPGAPPLPAGSGTGSGNSPGSSIDPYAQWLYMQKQLYNSGQGGYGPSMGMGGGTSYDPSNPYGLGSGLGYGGGYPAPGSAGAGYQSPSQLQAIATLGAANAAKEGQIGAAGLGADASKFGSQAGLLGTQNTNSANKDIATTQAGAATGVAGIGAEANKAIAELQKEQALGVANTQNIPALSKLQFLQSLTGSPGGILGGVFGNSLPGLGSNAGGGGGFSGAPSPGQPAVPTAQPMNARMLQANVGAGEAKNARQVSALSKQLARKHGADGFNMTAGDRGGGAINGALPDAEQMALNDRLMAANAQTDLDWQNLANTQDSAYQAQLAQLGLGQYNANRQFGLNTTLGLGQLGVGALAAFS